MVNSIINKGIPFGLLLAFLHVVIGASQTGMLKYHFNSLVFIGISTLGGILIGLLHYYIVAKRS